MKWKSVLDFINRRQPDQGYWLGSLYIATMWWDDHLSVGCKFNAWAIQYYRGDGEEKTRPWVSEFYASSALLVAAFALLVARQLSLSSAAVLGLLTVAWPTYRGLEILSLLLGWIFSHTVKIHSAERSLAGFILNIAELSCLFASIKISIGCIQPSSKIGAFIDGMVDLLTLSHHQPISLSVGGIFEAVQIFFGVLLVLVVVGSLAGGVLRRSLHDRKK